MAQHPKRIDNLSKRRAQGLTHKELSDEYGVSRQHVGRLLKKKIDKDQKEED